MSIIHYIAIHTGGAKTNCSIMGNCWTCNYKSYIWKTGKTGMLSVITWCQWMQLL